MTSQWEQTILEYLRLRGWVVAHFRPAQTVKGWRTPVSADGKGFPDFVAVRERIVYIEAKGQYGKLTPEQKRWRQAIHQAGGEHHILRPSDQSLMESLFR